MDEWAVLNWFGENNYAVMQWSNEWWWPCWTALFFFGTFIGMSPLSTHHEQSFLQIIGVWLRRCILFAGFTLVCMPFIMLFIYDMTMQYELGDHVQEFLEWFKKLLLDNWWMIIPAMLAGWTMRFCYNRYFLTFLSSVGKKLRRNQTNDKPSDILDEAERFKEKIFVPSKYYSDKGLTVGLGEDNKPVRIPWDVWKENMMQIIGPTGFGKGVILGGIAEQCIADGQTFFSINPKKDRFLPYIMFNAAQKHGRKFYYVSLREGEKGSWGPFLGGDKEDAFTRLSMAFKLELTGEPKTDFYKRQELRLLRRVFKNTQRIDGLFNEIVGQGAETAEAELEIWKDYKSLCPSAKKGFSIAKAIEENAVVYVQGSLDNRVIKTATKIFIAELIQESRRLWEAGLKQNHLTIAIDETSFVVSKVVKEALATIRSYEVSIINAYQSPDDLLNIEDDDIDGKSLQHSMNINSQIKAIYGGADYELAEWAALMSGTTTKQVTKMERTDVKAGGGETWENTRTVGTLEENLIHPNILLSLPKKVCIFKQPYELPKVLFTSFVPVSDKESLDNYIKLPSSNEASQEKTTNKPEPQKDNSAGKDASESSEDLSHFQEMAEQSESEMFESPFTPGAKSKEKPEKPKAKAKANSEEKEPISHAKSDDTPETDKPEGNDSITVKQQLTTPEQPSSTPSVKTNNNTEDEEAAKKKERNKARKERQKQKRKSAKESEDTSQSSNQEDTAKAKVAEVKNADPFASTSDDGLDAFLENVQSDDATLKALSEEEEA